MTWILLEAGIALALAIFIVWWTLPRAKRDAQEHAAKISEAAPPQESTQAPQPDKRDPS
jgi:hypothetical protein